MSNPHSAADRREQDIHAGQASYSKGLLTIYDFMVLGLSCRFAWGCTKTEIMRNYQSALGARHLEIGAGTGYFPDKAQFPVPRPEITLLDLNPKTLAFSSRRLARLQPRTVQANALDQLSSWQGVSAGGFDSVALNLLLHCIPGTIAEKADVIFANVAKAGRSGARVAGSTVLAKGVPASRAARVLIRDYNKRGSFHNADDSVGDLKLMLGKHFAEHTLTVRGCMALFSAVVP
ncbi:class I SAM-dependent methyltransferase [Streptomyces sparsogenes]|uniref:Methyltransferase type 12 n=1 Tax=Streptomyces sparsogenes DSM 40356 TaxID=1331668 RepID=A0A1R1SA42_9ACTN|nr:class I SAM-dependent methyltransferase [Streptomyces sparsogenes]OMI35143.1 Methyltransferase type 12 [Streptomyces sparsogenes DSM 40356]